MPFLAPVRAGCLFLLIRAAIFTHNLSMLAAFLPEGTNGVAVTKLKILDVLIEQLHQIKKQPTLNTKDLSNEQIDALISKYEGQIKAATAANNVMPYTPAPQVPAGMLFDISA